MPFSGLRRKTSSSSPNREHWAEASSDQHSSDDHLAVARHERDDDERHIARPVTAECLPTPEFSGPEDGEAPSQGFPTIGLAPPPRRRFSLKKYRHSSDPQLSARYRERSPSPSPPSPQAAPAPVIGITSPTRDGQTSQHKSKRFLLPLPSQSRNFRSTSYNNAYDKNLRPTLASNDGSSFLSNSPSNGNSSFETSPRPSAGSHKDAPPAHTQASLSVPRSRRSISSASDRTSDVGAAKTTAHTTTTFFKLPRRKKQAKGPLFPLPAKLSRPSDVELSSIANDHISSNPHTPVEPSPGSEIPLTEARPELSPHSTIRAVPSPVPASPAVTVGASSAALPSPKRTLARNDSSVSGRSSNSTPNMASGAGQYARARSMTSNSFSGRIGDERSQSSFTAESGRNSTSTTMGRNSLAGLRGFTSRLRHPSEQQSPRHGSPGGLLSSKNNSFALSRETLVVPEREEGETAGRYYSRLEKDIPKKGIAMALSKSDDPFCKDVLRSLLRSFKFYEEPMDIALRKFLWEIDLPGEAQQIDRVMSAFAERYHECNPHIFYDIDQVFFVAYSLIILHSDLFNKNNKRKMQRNEYQKNTGGHGIDEEILGYFYDNIQYTEFIAQDADDNESGTIPKATARKAKRVKTRMAAADATKSSKLDPYDFVVDQKLKLDILRASLKDVLNLDDTYSYLGTAERLDIPRLRTAFFRSGILQVVSARSRPEAFRSPSTINNPNEAHPGVVDIKVAKVGVLWRKDAKKKKTRSPWQEWGAILTSSQLYFFRNVGWVKGLVSQYESHRKHGNKFAPVIFKPPVEDFKPDFSVRTFNALALQDVSYRRHKHAFLLAQHEKHYEETVLAEDESEMNDWLAKINYSAVFTTSNITLQPLPSKMTGSIVSRQLSSMDEQTLAADFAEANAEQRSDQNLANLILDARKNAIVSKISDTEHHLMESRQRLEDHLRTARHLQILAPFPPRTRSDLLSFGARIAHKVRWSRYEIWQSKCQKEVLTKEIDENENPDKEVEEQDMARALSPILSTGKLRALQRFNSKASALVSPQRSSKPGRVSPYLSPSSAANIPHDHGLSAGIDEAFATPPDMLSKSTSSHDGPFKLPPLSLGNTVIGMDSDLATPATAAWPTMAHQTSHSSIGGSMARHSISASSASSVHEFSTPTPSVHEATGDSTREQRAQEVAVESDKEQTPAHASPSGRANVRRSLHRTLRDSRDGSSSLHSRGKRGKGSMSSNAGGENPLLFNENETLPRGSGSFKVHGKKASVITLPTDWQQTSAEERMRARKPQLQPEDNLNRLSLHSLGEAAWRKSVSDATTVSESSHPGTFEDQDDTGRSSSTTAPEVLLDVAPELIVAVEEEDKKGEAARA